jgi:hypothetical protein
MFFGRAINAQSSLSIADKPSSTLSVASVIILLTLRLDLHDSTPVAPHLHMSLSKHLALIRETY